MIIPFEKLLKQEITRKDINYSDFWRKFVTKRVKRIKYFVQPVICIHNGILDTQLLFGS